VGSRSLRLPAPVVCSAILLAALVQSTAAIFLQESSVSLWSILWRLILSTIGNLIHENAPSGTYMLTCRLTPLP
jgi:hypothetical protein